MKTTRRDFLKADVTIAGAASGVSAASEVVFSSDASARQSSEHMGEALPVPPTAQAKATCSTGRSAAPASRCR